MPDTYIVTPMCAYFLDDESRLCAAPVNEDDTVDWDPMHGGPVDRNEARTEEELAFVTQLPLQLLLLNGAVGDVLASLAPT